MLPSEIETGDCRCDKFSLCLGGLGSDFPWNHPPTESLVLSLLRTSATWWKDSGVTSKQTIVFIFGTRDLIIVLGQPLTSLSYKSKQPPSSSDQGGTK